MRAVGLAGLGQADERRRRDAGELRSVDPARPARLVLCAPAPRRRGEHAAQFAASPRPSRVPPTASRPGVKRR